MSGNFKIAVLASGSKGNTSLISTGKQNFLVDVGVSCRALTQRLAALGLEAGDLDGVFLTHEHIDHVKGLAAFCKKYAVPVFASEKTWRAVLSKTPLLERRCCRLLESAARCGEVTVESFAVPHDAADTRGYIFTAGGKKCVYVTDTGFVTENVRQAVEGADAVILEANHDVAMLKNGSYPPALKQRILSTRGHLSNECAGWLLAQLDKCPEKVILAHLSQENNLPSLALQTVGNILDEAKRLPDTQLLVASQDEIVGDKDF